ncbi:hypothetical protein [Hymenobacter sp. CRA2]|uniref:hypothetical protein n=1 Tax=Hymenobacter sp. CRA2 TaxID=1955620 RepID=UPI001116E064|nr:hypothetical protein [Hymenobacter sp. CRA2]
MKTGKGFGEELGQLARFGVFCLSVHNPTSRLRLRWLALRWRHNAKLLGMVRIIAEKVNNSNINLGKFNTILYCTFDCGENAKAAYAMRRAAFS